MRHYCIILGFLFFVLRVNAQEYFYKNYNQSNGLPQNTVNSLFFDSLDRLWILTEDGLVKFNGNSFDVIHSKNNPLIKFNRFRWVLPTYGGKYIFATSNGSLYSMKGDNIEVVDTVNKTHALLSGVISVNKHTKYIQNNAFNKTKYLFRVYPTPVFANADTDYVYTMGVNCIYKHNGDLLLDTIAIPKGTQTMLPCNGNTYFIGNYGMAYVDYEKKNTTPIVLPNELKQKKGIRWFQDVNTQYVFALTNNRIYVLSFTNKKTVKIVSQVDLPPHLQSSVTSVAFHGNSKLFACGTLQSGVYIFYPNSFSVSNYAAIRLNQTGFNAHAFVNDTTVLTSDGFACTLQQVKATHAYLFNHHKLPSNDAMVIDKNKVLWTFTFFELRIQPPFKPIKELRNIYSEKIGAFVPYGDSMFVVFSNKVLLYYNYMLVDSAIIPAHRLQPEITIAACLYQNSLLVSNNNGVYQINLDNLKQVAVRNKLHAVKYIYTYRDTIFWVQSNRSIWVEYQNAQYQLPADKLGLLNNAHNIYVTPQELVIIGTNQGLLTTTLSEVRNYLTGNKTQISYNYFTTENGLLNAEFNGGMHTIQSGFKNGWLTMANMGGIVWFNPNKVQSIYGLNYKPYIKSIFIDGNKVTNNDTLVLKPGNNRLAISLASVYWANINDVSYAYKIDNETWIELQHDDPNVVFTNLNPGSYELYIKGEVGGIINKLDIIKVTIIRLPYFYQTWWFKLLVLVSVVLVIIWAVQYYTNRLKASNLMLEAKVQQRTQKLIDVNSSLQKNVTIQNKLITIISHDIATPLKFISNVITHTITSDNRVEQQEVMKEVKSTANRLYNHSQNLLNWMRYQSEMITPKPILLSPYVIAENIVDLFGDLANHNSNLLELNVNMDALVETDAHILAIMLQNLIANAVNHNHHTHVNVYSTENDTHFLLGVKDNGKGIRLSVLRQIVEAKNKVVQSRNIQNAESTSLGYIILFDLAKLANIKIKLYTGNGGTDVQLIIPKV